MRIAIVTIGYNRVHDFARLINSLRNAQYEDDVVDLIMSIDNSGSDLVENFAASVDWPYGERIIRTYKERQGLKKHILQCGNYLEQYDALVVLEDDIVVSKYYYRFVKECVQKYSGDKNVAGISLYTHVQNVYAKYPFAPARGKYDVYFLPMAQSWGQVWLKEQWKEFVLWYEEIDGKFTKNISIATQVFDWGNNSWLKYHIRYCIEKNKYFVYPYDSLSTCFSSVGEHMKTSNTIYQVPMLAQEKKEYLLPECGEEGAIYYDAFFERQFLSVPNVKSDELELDLYGTKSLLYGNKRYLITVNDCSYKQLDCFGLQLRPHELNIEYGIKGDIFKLYDTQEKNEKNEKTERKDERLFSYYHKIGEHKETALKVVIRSITIAIKTLLWKKIRRR